ncbi:MAG: 4Fe-4S dicluster domain-containing protein [Candidatus Thorarchaeota archaeon]
MPDGPEVAGANMQVKNFLAINTDLCTGCRNCELACSMTHTQSFNPKRSRIQILKEEMQNLVVPMVCLQCESPLCKNACPTNAIQENDQGILFVNEQDCIGCANCVTACIYGGIEMDPRTRKAIKCDLCGGDPACVRACEYGAITLVTTDDGGYVARREALSLPYRTIGLLVKEGPE